MSKTALVTGASRGIGKAIAHALGEAGFTVIGTATSANGAERISAAISNAGHSGTGMVVDIASPDSIEDLMTEIKAGFDAPAVLVNNAGITRDNLMLRMKADEWTDVIDTNLNSLFYISKACLRGMTKARWGRIINVSSVVGSMGNPGQANYAAAKAGMQGFTRSLAAELGSRNVTVNCVAPGFIDTDMTKELPQEQREALQSQIPLTRLGQPEEIASLVAFLAGDGGGYITGETIHVNGGMYMQ